MLKDATSSPSFMPEKKIKVKADVIILGCTLPGIVTAHKLKTRFGDTMDIVVLDLAGPVRTPSKCNVGFQKGLEEDESDDDYEKYKKTAKQLVDNVARYYLAKYATEFNLPLPEAIIAPERVNQKLNKLFQYINGNTVECTTDYHDYKYLSFLEKFELNQYQTFLDQSMSDLFQTPVVDTVQDRSWLMFYDRTTMEEHICGALIFNNSREIMRTTVKLVCGASPETVSVLFYLHQCHRTNSSRNMLDGDNTRFREKLMGYCRKRLSARLLQSISDITYQSKPIKRIKKRSDERVVLETMKGGTTYVCNLLALALKPDELHKINVEDQDLLSQENLDLFNNMSRGRARKFFVQYKENFWERQGYSGDILSVRGPIVWAIERPKMSATGSVDRYSALIGYLMVDQENENKSSRQGVLEQLVKLFGDEAADPVSYKETSVADIFVPKCGDFVALSRLTAKWRTPKYVEWGALDVFADGDVAAALEAGHTAYLHLLSCLRPQAQTYEDLSTSEWPTTLCEKSPFQKWLVNFNLISSMKWSAYLAAAIVTLSCVRMYLSK